MDVVIKIAAIGIITAFCCLILKERSAYSVLLGVLGGVSILLIILDYFFEIFDFFDSLISMTGLDNSIVKTVLKIVGIGYIIDFAADTAVDAGKEGLAKKIVFGGKVIIFCLIIPILTELMNLVISMING